MDDEVNIMRGSESGRQSAHDPFTRKVNAPARVGNDGQRRMYDRGLHSYDRVEGEKKSSGVYMVSTADRMSEVEARRNLDAIHAVYGVANETEGVLFDFDRAFFLCLAINGTSALMPVDTVSFSIVRDGVASTFKLALGYEIIRNQARRFGRAYSNDIHRACVWCWKEADANDPDIAYLRAQMQLVAFKRNVMRTPWLISDCVDACLGLDPYEYVAIDQSGQFVIGSSNNAVDRISSTVKRSADGYDSSLNQVVPAVEPVSYRS